MSRILACLVSRLFSSQSRISFKWLRAHVRSALVTNGRFCSCQLPPPCQVPPHLRPFLCAAPEKRSPQIFSRVYGIEFARLVCPTVGSTATRPGIWIARYTYFSNKRFWFLQTVEIGWALQRIISSAVWNLVTMGDLQCGSRDLHSKSPNFKWLMKWHTLKESPKVTKF